MVVTFGSQIDTPQGGEALHEFQQRHDDMGGAVLERALQLQHDIAGAAACHNIIDLLCRPVAPFGSGGLGVAIWGVPFPS